METPSKWSRQRKQHTATRADGLSVAFVDDVWWLAHPGVRTPDGSLHREKLRVLHHSVDTNMQRVDRAIALADAKYPPPRWSMDPDTHVWTGNGWKVAPFEEGWSAARDGAVATSKVFPTADAARVWAELRFSRAKVKLRGPRPRGETPSSYRFPDIRVNVEERRQLEATLEALGCSYAVFVRATCRWAFENATGDHATWQLRDGLFERNA